MTAAQNRVEPRVGTTGTAGARSRPAIRVGLER